MRYHSVENIARLATEWWRARRGILDEDIQSEAAVPLGPSGRRRETPST